MEKVRILSIDGGGIQGVIPARVLVEIEQKTGKRICELFDYIAGTSTGGVLALGLTKPVPGTRTPQFSASEVLDLFVNGTVRTLNRSLGRRVSSLQGWNGPKYSGNSVEAALTSYFGDAELKDALTNLLVPAYEIERGMAVFFRSWKAATDPACNFLMRDVAGATSAAPTYFPPKKVPTSGGYWALIDGAVFASNPTMLAYLDAKTMHPEAKEFVVVSLGTGNRYLHISYDKAVAWGLAGWTPALFGVLMNGETDAVHREMQELVPGVAGAQRYFRIQTDLPKGDRAIDDASPARIHSLKGLAERLLTASAAQMTALCGLL